MNRILLEPSEVNGDRVELTGYRAEHIRGTLRAEIGQSVRIGVINGARGRGCIQSIAECKVVIRITLESGLPPRSSVNLLLALPRPKVLKRLWAPLASLGVNQVILLHAEKVEKSYWSTHTLHPEFYRPLLIEGLQQCGDTQLPDVRCVRAFRPFAEDELPELAKHSNRLLAYEGQAPRLRSLRPFPETSTWLAVGPEGGWNGFELERMQQVGFRSFSLGDRVLRSDVACISAISLIHEALG